MGSRPGRRIGRIRRPVMLLGAVVAGLLVGVGIDIARSNGLTAWLARHGLQPPYVAAGQRYDIGDRALYLDCRGAGSPTVVLEAGSGSDSATWSPVHDEIAATTRTCAYDRAGRARSDPRGRHTLADAAADLRALLAVAGEPPPFVVVGHSLGGDYIRVFAARHKGEVGGLVMIDTFDPDLQEDWIHPLLGSLLPEYEHGLDGLRAVVSQVDGLDWTASEIELRASSVAGLPIEVLTAPRFEARLDAERNRAIEQARLDAFDSLSPGRVHQVTALGAGHMVQFDRPDLVIDAVRRVIELVRG